MRLTDLSPRWGAEHGRHGQTLFMRCPVCRTRDVAIPFMNPIDGGRAVENRTRLWHRTGDTFDTLSIAPEVVGACCWSGRIVDGEVVNAGHERR